MLPAACAPRAEGRGSGWYRVRMQFNGRMAVKIIRMAMRLVRSTRSAGSGGPASYGGSGNPPPPRAGDASGGWQAGGYPGDFTGSLRPTYRPEPDGEPDPGEVVWAWVPYEEDHAQGKDRPVLLVGHDGPYLLGLMLTSKDRNNGRNADPNYVDIGSGRWDTAGRESEVKLDRVVRLEPGGIRREGAVLDKSRFDVVASRLTA